MTASELRVVHVAGHSIRLHAPLVTEIVETVGGCADGPGDAELQTWAVPWESGLFAHMVHWELAEVDVLDLGCGLGLAGCFAALRGARSVFFADRSEVAVKLAMASAAANAKPDAACHVHALMCITKSDVGMRGPSFS